MGKEWLYWGGSGGGGGGASDAAKKRRSRGGGGVMEEASSSAPPGCMCAVFQFWDLHHLPFTFPHHQARPSLSPDISDTLVQDESSGHRKGLEAPRNSLELNSCILEAASSSSTMKLDENLNIPNMGIRIKTNTETKPPRTSISSYRAKNEDILLSSSECNSNSPGIKPPNLVARLMGLDLLPVQTGSPSSFSRQSTPSLSNRSHSTHPRSHHDVSGTFSLPETPRISLARKSDVDHHRLSLQCSKENIEERLDMSFFGVRKMVRKDLEEESESASQYAKRIVKRMKEKVSRKVGVDITNTITNNRQDNNLVLLKPKKISNGLRKLKEDSSSSNQSTPACSPRLSFLDNKKKSPSSQTLFQKPEPVRVPKKTKDAHEGTNGMCVYIPVRVPKKTEDAHEGTNGMCVYTPVREPKKTEDAHEGTNGSVSRENLKSEIHKPNGMANRGIKAYDVIRNKIEEPFICSMDKKMKKNTPLKELTSNSVPTLIHKRKDLSIPITHFQDKQLAEESDVITVKRNTQQLPSCSSRSYNNEMLATKSLGQSEYYRYYIQRILKRIGIDKDTPVSLAKWYSPTHPIDPSVFHYLELFNPTGFGPNRRCDRKLVFHLIDELLVDILNLNSWGVVKRETYCGSELIDVLSKKIGEFPGANCQVLEDIDALIEIDSGKFKCFDDLESVVIDIELDIIDKILKETLMVVYDVGYTSKM